MSKTLFVLTLLAAATSSVGAQTLATRVTASRDVVAPMPFAIVSLKVEGVVRPAAGKRLYVVAIALGGESIEEDVARFLLVGSNGTTYEPIGAGGLPEHIVPLDRIPIDREVGEVLPTDAVLSLLRLSATRVSLEVGPNGTVAFLYELPAAAPVRALRLPDGRELPTSQ